MIYTNSSDIYSSQYSVYRDTIIQYAEELAEVNAKVEGAHIIFHENRDSGVTVVTYDNGVRIYINYGETDVDEDGHRIQSMSYEVVE